MRCSVVRSISLCSVSFSFFLSCFNLAKVFYYTGSHNQFMCVCVFQDSPLVLQSDRNVTVNARNNLGQLTGQLTVGEWHFLTIFSWICHLSSYSFISQRAFLFIADVFFIHTSILHLLCVLLQYFCFWNSYSVAL